MFILHLGVAQDGNAFDGKIALGIYYPQVKRVRLISLCFSLHLERLIDDQRGATAITERLNAARVIMTPQVLAESIDHQCK